MKTFEAYAAYYDLLYQDKNYAEEAQFVHQILRRHGPAAVRLLELGCGTGAHANELVNTGYEVLGIDLSPMMVERARKSTANPGIRKPGFEVGDARSFRHGSAFDAVLSLFHVMNYQATDKDLLQAFTTAATHLPENGLFIFDSWYGPAVLSDPPVVRVKRVEGNGLKLVRIAEPTVHPNENIVDVKYSINMRKVGDSNIHEIEELHRMRYLFLPETKALLKCAGFELAEFGKWLKGTEPGLDSWFVYFVARKRG